MTEATADKGLRLSDEDTKTAIDERVEWIQAVVADAMERGGVAIREAINDLDPQHYPSLLYMLLSSRTEDLKRVREIVREQVARDQFEVLESDEDVTLH